MDARRGAAAHRAGLDGRPAAPAGREGEGALTPLWCSPEVEAILARLDDLRGELLVPIGNADATTIQRLARSIEAEALHLAAVQAPPGDLGAQLAASIAYAREHGHLPAARHLPK